AAIFVMSDGKLRLEDLEFKLRPSNAEYLSQSVVNLLGGGQCTMKDCAVTLDRAGRETALHVASLSEPGKAMMKMDSAPPTLEMENCIVRGDGDLALSRGGQPFDIRLRNSLAVLRGSLLQIVQAEAGAAGAQRSALSLVHVTSYLDGPVLRMQAGKELKDL